RRLAAGAALAAAAVAALDADAAAAAAPPPRQCPAPHATEGLLTTTHSKKAKSCPGFKDDPAFVYCCPSKIEAHSYYCCTEEAMLKNEAEESSRQWKEFFSAYIGAIIGVAALLLFLSVCIGYIVCRRYCLKPRECGWYSQEGENYNPDRIFTNRAKRRRTTIREAELAAAQMDRSAPAYRPIEGNHKIYEASTSTNVNSHSSSAHAPHHSAHQAIHHLPPPQSIVDQQRNDWNCLIENEVNDGRPTLVPTLPPPPF
ncbi:hypothetical protein PFISCL1PPCAC_17036, partial [Pristionchus fissidentatus]